MILCMYKKKLYIFKKVYVFILIRINYHSITHHIFIADSHANAWIIWKYLVSLTHFSRDIF